METNKQIDKILTFDQVDGNSVEGLPPPLSPLKRIIDLTTEITMIRGNFPPGQSSSAQKPYLVEKGYGNFSDMDENTLTSFVPSKIVKKKENFLHKSGGIPLIIL